MSIAYFAHELADPAVQKRVRMLRAGGSQVELLGFERKRFAANDGPAPHVLGRTANGKLFARIFSVLFAIPRAWRLKPVWARADVLLARNLEMLVIVTCLTQLTNTRTKIIYECLDIHRLLLAQGIIGRVVRALERACLKRVALVLTSSPAFDAHYFRAVQHYDGETLIVENKVLALTDAPRFASLAPRVGPPRRIAWCGVLRCRKSFDLLRDLATTQQGRVAIDLWGAPALDQIPDFHALVAATPGMSFHGAYRPEDLPRLYGDAHFVWAIDYYEQGANSDWLLPNRLYEGLYFGAPPIAVAGVETARWLSDHKVGVVLDEPLAQSLRAFLEGCTPETYAALRRDAAGLDPQSLAFTLDNCRDLTARLVQSAALA